MPSPVNRTNENGFMKVERSQGSSLQQNSVNVMGHALSSRGFNTISTIADGSTVRSPLFRKLSNCWDSLKYCLFTIFAVLTCLCTRQKIHLPPPLLERPNKGKLASLEREAKALNEKRRISEAKTKEAEGILKEMMAGSSVLRKIHQQGLVTGNTKEAREKAEAEIKAMNARREDRMQRLSKIAEESKADFRTPVSPNSLSLQKLQEIYLRDVRNRKVEDGELAALKKSIRDDKARREFEVKIRAVGLMSVGIVSDINRKESDPLPPGVERVIKPGTEEYDHVMKNARPVNFNDA